MNLPELIDNKKDVQLKPVSERVTAIIEYRKILIALLREIKREVNASVIPAYSADRKIQVDSASWFAGLKAIAEQAISTATLKASNLFLTESGSHWKRFVRSIYSGVGINLPDTARPDSHKLLETYTEQNASLIKSLSDDAVKRVEQAVYSAKLNNQSIADLSKELQKQFGILKSRADLIAVDQMASLNADFNEARQRAVGIDSYSWKHQGDSRVRSLHRSLRGNVYKWGERTGAENGLPPGKPIRCRCVAIPHIPARA